MNTDTSPPAQEPYWPGQPRPRKPFWPELPPPRHRVFWWVFLAAEQVIFLGWVIYSGVSAPQNGLGIQMGLWAVTFLITCAIYFIWQLRRSPR